jgi:hypothetical protein
MARSKVSGASRRRDRTSCNVLSDDRKETSVTSRSLRIIVITSPDQLDQEWINRLAREAEVERLDRVGSVAAGVLLAQQHRPHLVIVDRDVEQTESAIRQIFTQVPSTLCIAVTPSHGIALQDIQKHLRYPVGANIPSEGQPITHSINRGVPVVMAHPQSWASQSFLNLAAYVAGDGAQLISLERLGGKKAGKGVLPGAKDRRSLFSLGT